MMMPGLVQQAMLMPAPQNMPPGMMGGNGYGQPPPFGAPGPFGSGMYNTGAPF